jgi:hypothetical protein
LLKFLERAQANDVVDHDRLSSRAAAMEIA